MGIVYSCEQFIKKLKLDNSVINPLKDVVASQVNSVVRNYNLWSESNCTLLIKTNMHCMSDLKN